MVVDVTNLEPSQKINLKIDNSQNLVPVIPEKNYNKSNTLENNATTQNQDKLDINNKQDFQYRNILEAKNFAMNVNSTLNELSTKLNQLQDIAEQNIMPEIQNDTLYQNQYKFEELKNQFNNFVENVTYRNNNMLQQLNNEGITFNINNREQQTFKLNGFNVNGFNSNNFKIENLSIRNEDETKNTITALNQAQEFFKNEEKEFDLSLNQLNEELLNLLRETNVNMINDTTQVENTNQINDITDLLLKNPNEFFNSQANLQQESYLELLQD